MYKNDTFWSHIRPMLKGYTSAIVIAALSALLFRMFVLEAFKIPTDFMHPSLFAGDYIFVNKMAYKKFAVFNVDVTPERGDVVVFSFPNNPKKDFIKRVIAIAGDEIEMRDTEVFVNGQSIAIKKKGNEIIERLGSHTYTATWTNDAAQLKKVSTLKVPSGQMFVLGDSRTKGQDSRNWGFVATSTIEGKAAFIWFSKSKDNEGKLKIQWNRILKRID